MRWPRLATGLLLVACGPRPVDQPRSPLSIAPAPASVAPAEQAAPRPGPRLEIHQAARVSTVRDGDVVRVSRGPLELRFELDHYDSVTGRFFAARLTLSEDEEPLKLSPGSTDHSGSEPHPFGEGSGFAGDPRGYRVLVLDPRGSHYLFHDPADPLTTRVDVVESLGPSRSLVALPVHTLFVSRLGEHHTLETLPLDRVFAAFFVDRDLDGAMAEDELVRFTVLLSEPPR